MKKILFLLTFLTLSLAHSLSAQPTSIDVRQDTLITISDTLALQARHTNVVMDITSASRTITIDRPTSSYEGFVVTIAQLNAASGRSVTVATLGGSNDFQGGASLSTTFGFTADIFQVTTFTCLEVASGTFKWVKIN